MRFFFVALLASCLLPESCFAAAKVSLSESSSCSREKDKQYFRLSEHPSYLVCGGAESHAYRIQALSVCDNPGQVRSFNIQFKNALVAGINIIEISVDEQLTILSRHYRVDGVTGIQDRLFLGNNKTGEVTAVNNDLPDACNVSGQQISPNAESLVYSVLGIEYKTDFNTTATQAHGCLKQYVGYYHFDISIAKFQKRFDQVSQTMLTHSPLIGADSKNGHNHRQQ